jgi:2-polyprenyl-6-methoxyphenol hydroxylase-like FAD-dependent oxidoreductase
MVSARTRRGHAIVIGASMAGLLAARVLAEGFGRVTIIERDAAPDGSAHRKGVPQGAHAHGLLARGLGVMTRLFPDLLPDLVAAGVPHVDFSALGFHQFGVWKRRCRTGIDGVMLTRPFLEWHVRRRVAALANVTILAGHRVTSLGTTGNDRHAAGVTALGDAGDAVALEADLVLDASGRGSRTPGMLQALGLGGPEESVIGVDLAYATRLYRRHDFTGSWKGLLVMPRPPRGRRMGVLLAVEGDRWVCTLGGWHGDHPPPGEAGFLDFARSLPVAELHDVIANSEPLSPIGVYRFPASLRRHYERMALPSGFAVLGDALCSFNPVYGQGMTVSAVQADVLATWLRESPAASTAVLQQRLAAVVDNPWLLAAGEDLRWPATRGPRSLGTTLVNAYIGRLHRAAALDDAVTIAFYRVMHMLEEPETLFRPAMVTRVLSRSALGGRPATLEDSGPYAPPSRGGRAGDVMREARMLRFF